MVLAASLATQAMAAEPAGEAVAVVDQAMATGSVGERTLTPGAAIFLGDRVATDAAGETQLLFADGTRMVVGSDASLVIEAFLFRRTSQENAFTVRALGGAYRFISGRSGEAAYSIRTPAATISVRGTAFDFTVEVDRTALVLLDGSATLCADGGDCVTAAKRCEMVESGRGRGPRHMMKPRMQARQMHRDFPYLSRQTHLHRAFRVNLRDCLPDAARGFFGAAGDGTQDGEDGQGGGGD